MKLIALLQSAAVGWVAGVLAMLILTFAWPSIFPGFVNYKHYDPTGPAPNLGLIVLIDVLAASLPALVGGVVGGRLPKEGGRRQELLMAGIFGIILAVPVGCFGLYLFSGY
jgi:MFS family permease